MSWIFRNVNEAFRTVADDMAVSPLIRFRESRNGPVRAYDCPVGWTYRYPRERVLFNAARNANPYFHMYEAMWMLAGRNDVKSVAHYCKQMQEYSDDGERINDAYGYRWRNWFQHDQLKALLNLLSDTPDTRRAALGMWDPNSDLTNQDSKALPCNLMCLFDIQHGHLNMTVLNRSNDMLWGAFGANAVHFSFLLEYVALMTSYKIGYMHTFSNNLHAYQHLWKPDKWLDDSVPDFYQTVQNISLLPLAEPHEVFDLHENIEEFTKNPTDDSPNKFLRTVACPMMRAWEYHKVRNYDLALSEVQQIAADDWQFVSEQWMRRAQRIWETDDK